MALQCPSCNSDNVQKVELAYMAGTASGGRAARRSSGTHQTELAKSLAPPSNHHTEILKILLVLAMASLIGGSFIAMNMYSVQTPSEVIMRWPVILCVVFLAMAGYFLQSDAAKRLKSEFAKATDDWKNSCICHKCGNRFLYRNGQVSSIESAKPPQVDIDDELIALVAAGKKVDAVKRYREASGARLEEAVKYVESL